MLLLLQLSEHHQRFGHNKCFLNQKMLLSLQFLRPGKMELLPILYALISLISWGHRLSLSWPIGHRLIQGVDSNYFVDETAEESRSLSCSILVF